MKQKYINIDLDGVVGNYTDTFRRYAATICGVKEEDILKRFPEPTTYDSVIFDWFDSRKAFERAHTSAVKRGMFKHMEIIPGAVDAINRIQQAGIKIRVTTSRFVTSHQYATAAKDTIDFTDLNAIPVDDYVFTNSKGDIRSIIAIDDSPGNIETYTNEGLDVITFSQPYNVEYTPAMHPHIKLRSGDWKEIADFVIEEYA